MIKKTIIAALLLGTASMMHAHLIRVANKTGERVNVHIDFSACGPSLTQLAASQAGVLETACCTKRIHVTSPDGTSSIITRLHGGWWGRSRCASWNMIIEKGPQKSYRLRFMDGLSYESEMMNSNMQEKELYRSPRSSRWGRRWYRPYRTYWSYYPAYRTYYWYY